MQRVQHLSRPTDDPLAFRRDALKGTAALDDGDAQLLFQLANAVGQGGL
ncbi:hypothetical protein [Aquirhabdus parva]|nr:hypothetical protein [Aquirhabdus parva]